MRLLTSAIVLLLVPLLPAQNALQQHIDRAIVDLGDAQQASAAAEQLQRLGRQALPSLRQLLAVAPYGAEPTLRLRNALFVLGRLGRTASDATGAVSAVLQAASHAEDPDGLQRQALWALSQIGPFAEERQRQAAIVACRARPSTDNFLFSVTVERLWLGPAPADSKLLELLQENGASSRVAAAQALASRAPAAADDDPLRLLAADQLQGEMCRSDFPWADGVLVAAPYLAAWLAECGERGPDLWRALLHHFDPFLRLRGVTKLRDEVPTTRAERTEALALLWDSESEVREAAVTTLLAWHGAMAVAPLAAAARDLSDATYRSTCTAALQELTAEPALAGPRCQQLLAVAQGLAPAPAVAATDHAASEVFAELLAGAEWCNDDGCERLLQFAESQGLTDGICIRAVLRLLANQRLATARAAAGWLCRRDTAVAQAYPAVDRLGAIRASCNPDLPLGVLAECHAFALAGHRATTEQLAAALDSNGSRLIVRAACELVRRGPLAIRPLLPRLRQVEPMWWTWLPDQLGERLGWSSVDLSSEVRCAVALARAVVGDMPWDDHEVVALVAREHDCSCDEARTWLLAHGNPETALQLADRVEQSARQLLGADDIAAPK